MAHEVYDDEEVIRIFDQWKREVLEELREDLVKDIDPQRFYASLRSNRVIDGDDEEEIRSGITRKRRAECFLNILSTKGSNGFDYFCKALLEATGQQFLLRNMLNAFQMKRQVLPELNHTRELPPLRFSGNLPSPGQIGGPELPSGYVQIMNGEPPPAYRE